MTLRIIHDAHPVVVIADVNEELKSKGLVFVGCGNPTRRTLTWELEKLPEKTRSEAMSQRIKVGDEVWLDHSRWRQTKKERYCKDWPPNGSMGTLIKTPDKLGLRLFHPEEDIGLRWKVLYINGVFPAYGDCIPNNTLLACSDLIAFTRDEHCNLVNVDGNVTGSVGSVTDTPKAIPWPPGHPGAACPSELQSRIERLEHLFYARFPQERNDVHSPR